MDEISDQHTVPLMEMANGDLFHKVFTALLVSKSQWTAAPWTISIFITALFRPDFRQTSSDSSSFQHLLVPGYTNR
jgi:hypothetical protein